MAVAARFAHTDLVWVEEAYGLAAASELLRGRSLYADVWFDKPPLYAWFYTLCGALPGVALRLLGSAWVLSCAACVYAPGRALWGRREGAIAGALTLMCLTFWIPSAVIAIAPDLLMIAPHALAIALAVAGRSALAGVACGVALLCNSRAIFVVAAACLWAPSRLALIGGCAAIQAAALLWISPGDYWRQVWEWGFRYSAASFVDAPAVEAIRRTGGWAWFHAAAVSGSVVCLWRERNWRIGIWLLLGLCGVVAGLRFFPRYYFLLLPVICVAGARGIVMLRRPWQIVVPALLLIPVIRFGPRYVTLAAYGSAGWADAALMEDSRAAARLLPRGCELVVWGYRPDVYVFSGCRAAARFLDSQPLTGVIADRHLSDSTVTYPDLSRRNRAELMRTQPEFIVDGLGPANPSLAIASYSDLATWLQRYEVVGRTSLSIVYRLRAGPDRPALFEKG